MSTQYTDQQMVNHINHLVQGLSKELGAGWSVRPLDPERDISIDARRVLLSKEGDVLHVTFQRHPKPHVHISADFNRNGKYVSYNHSSEVKDETTSINVSVDKSPEAVANDMTRRLLPGCRKVLAYVRQRIAADEAYKAAKTKNGKRLMEILGSLDRFSEDRDSYSSHGDGHPHVDIQPSTDSVNLTVTSCPMELAARLCHTIQLYRLLNGKEKV